MYPVEDFDLLDVRDLFKLSVVCVSAGGVGEGAAVLHKMYIDYGVTQACSWRAAAGCRRRTPTGVLVPIRNEGDFRSKDKMPGKKLSLWKVMEIVCNYWFSLHEGRKNGWGG